MGLCVFLYTMFTKFLNDSYLFYHILVYSIRNTVLILLYNIGYILTIKVKLCFLRFKHFYF